MNLNILKLHLKELKCNLQTLKEYAAQLVRFVLITRASGVESF